MSNNQIGDLITAMTDLKVEYEGKRNAIAQEIDRLGGVVADHIQDINEVSTLFLNHIDNVYVDVESDGDNLGTSSHPFTSIVEALKSISVGRRRWAVINLKIGQRHIIDEFITVNVEFLQIHSWGVAAGTPFLNYASNQDLSSLQTEFATVENAPLDGDNGTYGILFSHPCRLITRNVILKTPSLTDSANASLNTGFIGRRDFFGKAQFIALHCYLDLGSPIARLASGNGGLHIELHANYYDISRLEHPILAWNFIFINAALRPLDIHINSPRNVNGDGVTGDLTYLLQKMISNRRFTSGDPSVQPCNVLSNLNFSATAVPII